MKPISRAAMCAAMAGVALLATTRTNATPINPYLILTISTQNITAPSPAINTVFCDQPSPACTAAGVLKGVTPAITNTSQPGAINVGAGTQGSIAYTAESSTALVGGPPGYSNLLATTALTVTNTSPTAFYSVSASLVAYGLQGPDNAFTAAANDAFFNSLGSIVNLGWYVDPSNSGITNPATQIAAYTSPPATTSLFTDHDLVSAAMPLITGLYSTTETWSYTLAPQGFLQNRLEDEQIIYTPEPAALLLLGTGSFALGIFRRRVPQVCRKVTTSTKSTP